jgi:hypothetical protein
MTFLELQTALAELLRVGEQRYSTAWRKKHINYAIQALSDEYSSPWDQDSSTFATVDGTQSYGLETLFSSPALICETVLHCYTLDSSDGEQELDELTIEQLHEKYPAGSDEGEPKVFAYFERALYLGPTPDDAYTVYVKYRGRQREMTNNSDTNNWTTYADFAVLYRAAEEASVFLLEDERVSLFRERWQSEMQRISTRHFSIGASTRPFSMEPGEISII